MTRGMEGQRMSAELLFVDTLKQGGHVKLRSKSHDSNWIELSADELDEIAFALRMVAESRDAVRARADLTENLRACNRLAEAGSNDEEIQTLQESLQIAVQMLGMEYPDGTE